MFWWRKRNEGFEWRDYVRTTILVRREQRRQKLKDVQAAAASHLKDAGHRSLDAGISGVRGAGIGIWSTLTSGAAILGSLLVRGGSAAARGIAFGAVGLWNALATLAHRAGGPLMPILEPALSIARSPKPNLALKLIAVLAGLGAAYRAWAFGFDTDARVAAAICIIAAALVMLTYATNPFRRSRSQAPESLMTRIRGGRSPHWPAASGPGLDLSPHTAGLATLALIGLAGLSVLTLHFLSPGTSRETSGRTGGSSTSASTRTGSPAASDSSKLEGRAVAIAGDRLRVTGTLVVLDSIEAPEPGQSCQRKTGKWRCGQAATDALADLVRGRRVSCDLVGEDENGLKLARCSSGGSDLAEKLVRNGSVFSNGGFLSRYASLEGEAQDEKIGLWSGDAERPQDYRAKRWDEARRTAPDGCPIKGRIRSGARTYVLPWQPAYDSLKLSSEKGERWFCSESEAQAAGWTPGSRS